MIDLRSALQAMHYTSVEDARRELGLTRPFGARALIDALKPPSKLQFRLLDFVEHESTDDTFQGPGDETYLSAIGSDSSSVLVGRAGELPQVGLIHSPHIGPAKELRDQWRDNPFVLLEFDLRKPGDWPRTYSATLLIVEHDNGDLAEEFDKLNSEVGQTIKVAVQTVAATAAGAAVGAVVGSVIPGIGTAVGVAVGALAGVAYNALRDQISSGLADEIFAPIPITIEITKPWLAAVQTGANVKLAQKVVEHGAHYDIFYDWHTVK
jgi:hypothetical protein